MLAILTTHPIQYQVPVWRQLASDGRVPFEVWFMTDHGTSKSTDPEFGKSFAWDIDMLGGYPHSFLAMAPGATPASFWGCRLAERLRDRLVRQKVTVLLVLGWQVGAYWQAIAEARKAGVRVWLRGESNDLAPAPLWKRPLKALQMGWLVRHVDRFLCIGSANRRLYERYGVTPDRIRTAPYTVDNARFQAQADLVRPGRDSWRQQWNIPAGAFCVLFCGKFIAKKRPQDLVVACVRLMALQPGTGVHLLFVGAGDLGGQLRHATRAAFDQDGAVAGESAAHDDTSSGKPPASFAGFLNQSEISRAYIAADCLVLPSDHGETWGLVANEALASGLPCVISDACGSAEDLGRLPGCRTFALGDTAALADQLARTRLDPVDARRLHDALEAGFSVTRTAATIVSLFDQGPA